MYIKKLDLTAFGPFDNFSLDFSERPNAFHLIYGHNEAGKSTSLRAIMGLLFGIPVRTNDAHTHKMSDLRIGASLGLMSGQSLDVVRRKGNKKTLLSPTNADVPESELAQFLNGIDEELFQSLFAMNHESLQTGGEALLSGHGKLGQSLFGAGLGDSDIPSLLQNLATESEALFSRRARKKPLNQSLSDFKQTRTAIRDLALKPAQWKKLQAEIQSHKAQQKELLHQETEMVKQIREIERKQNLLPRLARRRELLAELSSFPPESEYQHIPADCRERRTRLESDLTIATRRKQKLAENIEHRKQTLAELNTDATILRKSAVINGFNRSLGQYIKTAKDRPKVWTKANTIETEMTDLLAEIGSSVSLKEVDSIRLSTVQVRRIRELIAVRAEIAHTRKTKLEHKKRLEEQLRALDQTSQIKQSPEQITFLSNWLEVSDSMRKTVDKLASHRSTMQTIEQSIQNSSQKLRLTTIDSNAILALPAPDPEQLDSLLRQYDKKSQELDGLNDRIGQHQQSQHEILERIDSIQLRGHVVTEEELNKARAERDQFLQQITTTSSSESNLQSLAEHIKNCDHLSDRLWREAERVTELANLRADYQSGKRKASEIEELKATIVDELKELKTEFDRLISPIFNSAAIDRFKLRAIDEFEALREDIRSLKRLTATANELADEITEHLTTLNQREPHFALSCRADHFSHAVKAVREYLNASRDEQARRERIEFERSQKASEIAEIEVDLNSIDARLEQHQSDWRLAIEKLSPEQDLSTESADELLKKHNKLFQLQATRIDLLRRLKGMKMDMEALDAQVGDLVAEIYPGLSGHKTEACIEQLTDALDDAKEAATRKSELEKQLEDDLEELQDAELDAESARSRLKALLDQTGVDDIEKLAELEDTVQRARQVQRDLKHEEENILETGAGQTIEEIEALMTNVDRGSLDGERHELTVKLESLKKQRTELDREIGRLEKTHEENTGHDLAANKTMELEYVKAQCQSQLDRYMIAKFAETLLRNEIDEYRKQHQGPLLDFASEIFQNLTLGSFEKLAINYDQEDDPVLECVRPGGQRLGIEGLSTGSRDQLFLALRLASIRHFVNQNEPMPLICDDILVHFDNRRASAALKSLCDVHANLQVLFFTHHKQIVDLAKQHLPADRLICHEIDR